MHSEMKPVVFACAGCSYAGQIAYRLALELDRRGIAEMSCLAGLGAEKPVFMKLAERRPVWIIDGCPIECSAGITAKTGRPAILHIRLYEYGIKKKQTHPDSVDYDELVSWVEELARPVMAVQAASHQDASMH